MGRPDKAPPKASLKVAILGGGWAGMAAAVRAQQLGHKVTVYEAARVLGGRARGVECSTPEGDSITLDNGQHILIGAYRESLALMKLVGIPLNEALLATPLALPAPDGSGFRMPNTPVWLQRFVPGLDVIWSIMNNPGWTWKDKLRLLKTALRWRMSGFNCPPKMSVATLCQKITPRVHHQLIEPLCVSALNTPAEHASGQVFLRVLRDALFNVGARQLPFHSATLLLPRLNLSALFPEAAARWLTAKGAKIELGKRVQSIEPVSIFSGGKDRLVSWDIHGQTFDRVVIACQPSEAARLVKHSSFAVLPRAHDWLTKAQRIQFSAITTVYLQAPPTTRLNHAMLALESGPGMPAQFVFDRGQLGDRPGLLAFVVRASHGERDQLEEEVQAQAIAQLGLGITQVVQTVIEKRATFACTPGLQRPPMRIADGILACGDYIDGPYPATLEGAVISGIQAAEALW